MIIKKEEQPYKKPVIDLTGPDGNTFALMSYVKKWGRELGFTKEIIDEIITDMLLSDYEHLIEVIEENFGQYVILIR